MPEKGIVGPATYRLTFTPDGCAHLVPDKGPVELYNHYHVGDEKIAQAFGSTLPAELADLVDVALAVYVADRRSRRRLPAADRYHLHWTRQFHIRLPLRDPERWHDGTLAARLSDVLEFFTEDQWHFDFVPRSGDRRPSETQGFLFRTLPRAPVTAALFSGGLDSLAGLCRELVDRPRDSFVLFSGSTNQRTGSIQRHLARKVYSWLDREIIPVIVPFGLHQRGRRYDGDERTQRSRGFVFLALGAATAIMAGTDNLAVYENGVGAINLPYTDAQLGTHNTRTAHPLALAAMGDLISRATGRQFVFRSPFLFATKGQLCSSLGELGLGDLVSQTITCNGFPQRVAGRSQCGLCTSCLLRRQALYVAGLGAFDMPGAYRWDIFEPRMRVSDAKLYPFQAMLDQVFRMRQALDAQEPWQALSRNYPQLVEVAASVAATGQALAYVEKQLVELYRRYCDE
jgi:hypothetical protein